LKKNQEMDNFLESSWTFINSNNQAFVFILIVLLGIVIFGSLYVTVLCYALRGKLDFVYDQESGQPLNVIQIKGCCCCKRQKSTETP